MTQVDRAAARSDNSYLAELLDMSFRSGCGLYLGAVRGGAVFAQPASGLMVLGPPRCGKTSAVVVPNVLSCAGPVVSTSTKDDVMRTTAKARSSLGPCYLFDPSGQVPVPDGVQRIGWSPLLASGTWDGANRIALAMVEAARPGADRGESVHWSTNAKRLLAAAFHSGALAGMSFGKVADAVNSRDLDQIRTPLAIHKVETALRTLEGYSTSDRREMSGIWSTASSVLAGYETEAARATTKGRMIDPEAFASGRSTLYICAASDQQRLTGAVVAGLVNDLKTAAYTRASLGARQAREAEERADGRADGLAGGRAGGNLQGRTDGSPMLLALDEVANIAPLHDLPSILSEGSSQGVVTLACFQDLSQAKSRWPADWEGYLTTCQTKLVFPGIADVGTLDRLSRLAGQVEVPHRSTTRSPVLATLLGRGQSRSITVTTRTQPTLPVDAIAAGRPGQALHIDGVKPQWMPVVPWFNDTFLRSVVEFGSCRRSEIAGRQSPGRQSELTGLGAHERERGLGRSR